MIPPNELEKSGGAPYAIKFFNKRIGVPSVHYFQSPQTTALTFGTAYHFKSAAAARGHIDHEMYGSGNWHWAIVVMEGGRERVVDTNEDIVSILGDLDGGVEGEE
jgi:hypothetical protein